MNRLVPEDEESVRKLVAECGPRLFAAAVHLLCGHEAEAEDLVQRTFIRAIRKADSFRGASSVYTWLYSILLNEWRMSARAASRNPVLFTDTLPEPEQTAPPPSEEAERRSDAVALAEAVRSLPPDARAVIVLRFYEDMSLKEMAEVLDVPLGTVKSRLHAACGLLRERAGDEFEPFPGDRHQKDEPKAQP